jgi:uncharacterized protein YuzE
MLISYDPEVDGLHIELGSDGPTTSKEIAQGLTVDFDARGYIVGLSLLDATEILGRAALAQLIVEGLTTTVRPGEPADVYVRGALTDAPAYAASEAGDS